MEVGDRRVCCAHFPRTRGFQPELASDSPGWVGVEAQPAGRRSPGVEENAGCADAARGRRAVGRSSSRATRGRCAQIPPVGSLGSRY